MNRPEMPMLLTLGLMSCKASSAIHINIECRFTDDETLMSDVNFPLSFASDQKFLMNLGSASLQLNRNMFKSQTKWTLETLSFKHGIIRLETEENGIKYDWKLDLMLVGDLYYLNKVTLRLSE